MTSSHSVIQLFELLDGNKQHIVFHLRLRPLTFTYLEAKIHTHFTSSEHLRYALNELEEDGVLETICSSDNESLYGLTEKTHSQILPVLLQLWQWSWERIQERS